MSRYTNDHTPVKTPTAKRWFGLALGAAVGVAVFIIVRARQLAASEGRFKGFGFEPNQEQAVTVRAPLEEAEAAWVKWCASGHARLKNDYAVRFEPAPAAQGTQVCLSGGGSKGTIREELRRFKQLLETGEMPAGVTDEMGEGLGVRG